MINTTIRRLLVGGNEDDFKVGVALAAKNDIVREGIYAFEDVELWSTKMQLDKVRWLQNKYPEVIISGSIALFLHGCRTKRWQDQYYQPDLDLIMPHFIFIEGPKISKYVELRHPSGCDFQETYNFNGVKIDTTVDPQQRWEWITYDGYRYKVSEVLDIIQAKIKYCKKANDIKHRQDLYDFIGKTTFGEYLKKVNDQQTEMVL